MRNTSQNPYYIDKADESIGERFDLCYYYFKDGYKPIEVFEELHTKYRVGATLNSIKHWYKCGWFKEHIIEYCTHVPSRKRSGKNPITIDDYFASKGIKVEDL